jgi:putative tricarboxylic transport membrane protein
MDEVVAEEGRRESGGLVIENSDRASGLVICALASVALFSSRNLPYGSIGAPDSGFFPKTLSVLLLIFGSAISATAFANKPVKIDLDAGNLKVLVGAIALLLYAFALDAVGFVIATILILLLMMRGFGEMSWKASGLIAVVSVAIAYVGFLQLGVPLPRGPLPF